MALTMDDIRYYEMFAEPSPQPTPEEVTATKWLLPQIAKPEPACATRII